MSPEESPRLLVVQPRLAMLAGAPLPVGRRDTVASELLIKVSLEAADGGYALAPAQAPLSADDLAQDASEADDPPSAWRPRASAVDRAFSNEWPIELRCIAVREAIGGHRALLFAGSLRRGWSRGARDRVLVWLEREGEPLDMVKRLGDRARLHVHYAVESRDLEPGAEPPDTTLLTLERCALFEHRPQPIAELSHYAKVTAELAEHPEERATVLARHGYDEHAWALEERGWLERMADAALSGDLRDALAFGDAFVAESDRLAASGECEGMVHEYVAIRAALAQTHDLEDVLERWQLTLAQWFRLERYWRRRSAADPALEAELARLIAECHVEEEAR